MFSYGLSILLDLTIEENITEHLTHPEKTRHEKSGTATLEPVTKANILERATADLGKNDDTRRIPWGNHGKIHGKNHGNMENDVKSYENHGKSW